MIDTSIVSVRLPSDVKDEWSVVCDLLGVSISSVVSMLACQMILHRRLPFVPTLEGFPDLHSQGGID